jgi:hypothetical protein
LRRSLIGVAVTATFVLGVAASASAAPAPTGIYQGIVNGTSHSPLVCGTYHNEGEGYFKLRRNPNGTRSIVGFSSSNYCGGIAVPKITAPADPVNNCLSMNASFASGTVIPLTQGAFDKTATVLIGGNVPQYPDRRRVLRFKGSWDPSINRFKGFTTIRTVPGGGNPACNTGPKYWRMKRVSAN